MKYNIDFLVAALLFLLILWYHFIKQRQFAENKVERTFRAFTLIGIADITLDLVSTMWMNCQRPELSRGLYVILVLFYLCQLLVPPILYLYTLTLAGWSVEEKMPARQYICLIPTGILAILILVNHRTGWLFTVTADGTYVLGVLYLSMYVQAVWYAIVIGIESIHNYRELGKKRFGVIWEVLFIMVVCVLLQGYRAEFLMTGFAIALCIMVLLL